MSNVAAVQRTLLAELIAACLADYLVPVDCQDALIGALCEVDFDDTASMRTAARVISLWRHGGEEVPVDAA